MALRRVLLVEDSEVDALMLERGLREAVPRSMVVHCGTTHEAEEVLFPHPQPPLHSNPDLVVLDVRVPPSGGVSLLEKVRSNQSTKSIPVLMMSSDIPEDEIQALYNLGANSYLEKPLDYAEFCKIVTAAARYWLSLNLNVKQGR
jgi:two-component system response regulator